MNNITNMPAYPHIANHKTFHILFMSCVIKYAMSQWWCKHGSLAVFCCLRHTAAHHAIKQSLRAPQPGKREAQHWASTCGVGSILKKDWADTFFSLSDT